MLSDMVFPGLRLAAAILGILLMWRVLRFFSGFRLALFTLLLVWTGSNLAAMVLLPGAPARLLRLDLYLVLLLAGLHLKERFRWAPLLLLAPGILAAGFLARLLPACTDPSSWLYFGSPPADPFSLNPANLHRTLFSWQNGWLIYTPLAFVALAGLWRTAATDTPLFYTVFLSLVLLLLFAGSSPEEYFPGQFSHPALAEAWAVLAIPLAHLAGATAKKPGIARYLLPVLTGFMVILNLFQTFQFSRSILVPGRMTGKYYAAVFGRTAATAGDRHWLKPPAAVFSDTVPGSSWLRCKPLATYDFETPAGNRESFRLAKAARTGSSGMVLDPSNAFSPGIDLPLDEWVPRDSAWIMVSGFFRFRCLNRDLKASLAITCVHDGRPYKYRTTDLARREFLPGRWNRVNMSYLLDVQAAPGDRLQAYFMTYGPEEIFIDDLEFTLCQPDRQP